MTFVLPSSILFGNSTMVRLNLSHNPHRIQVDTQQVCLQSLFIKCNIKCNTVMQAPQIKEMIKEKIIIRNVKEREWNKPKGKKTTYQLGWNKVLSLP